MTTPQKTNSEENSSKNKTNQQNIAIIVSLFSCFFIIFTVHMSRNHHKAEETQKQEIIQIQENKEEKISEKNFKNEYESLNDGIRPEVIVPENIKVEYLDFENLKNTLENGNGIIFFGFPTCPWCRHMLPNLFDAMSENKIEKIYYYNPKEIRNKITKNENGELVVENTGTPEYDYILEKLNDILPVYKDLGDENIKRLYVPFVVIVKNGEILSSHLSTAESHTDKNEKMTDEQKSELKNIFIKMLEPLKENNLLLTEPCDIEKTNEEPC